jgi:hypothetical protein
VFEEIEIRLSLVRKYCPQKRMGVIERLSQGSGDNALKVTPWYLHILTMRI